MGVSGGERRVQEKGREMRRERGKEGRKMGEEDGEEGESRIRQS